MFCLLILSRYVLYSLFIYLFIQSLIHILTYTPLVSLSFFLSLMFSFLLCFVFSFVLSLYCLVFIYLSLSLTHTLLLIKVYDAVSKQTRKNFEEDAARPRAVLFEGPPGTGKTLTARIIASQVSRPLIYVSVENILSKWYGESERNLGRIFDICDGLSDGAIIFIDEVDSLAASRSLSLSTPLSRILTHTSLS